MTVDKKLSRRERERLRRRQEIISAALGLFAQKGYHNVSMTEIAERAEFAVGTLYKFFESKEALYNSLMVEKADYFHQLITTALAQGENEIEKLRNFVRAKGTVFKGEHAVVRIYFAETRGAGFDIKIGFDKLIREKYDQTLNMLGAIFAQGIEKKLFNDIAKPHHLASALDSICNSFLFRWLENPDSQCYPEDPDVILNILFKGLRAA